MVTAFSVHASSEPHFVTPVVNDTSLKMMVDTGATVSLIGHDVFNRHFKGTPLYRCDVTLLSVSARITVLGKMHVKVEVQSASHQVELLVCEIPESAVPLMGRPWLDILFPQWRACFSSPLSVLNVMDMVQDLSSILY